jgi:NitT/TauT family transport system substrate-binding protein
MLTRRALVGSSLGALAAISGCGTRSSTNLRVGYIPISDSLPLFVAQSREIFQREGLTVELLPLEGGARIIEGINAGSLDLGISNYVSVMLARESGLDLRLISGNTIETRANPQHGMLVRRDSPLTLPGLAGKRIAVNTLRNINELYVRAFLTTSGVDATTVTLVEVPFPRMIAALESNAVDVAGAIEPFVTLSTRNDLCRLVGRQVVDVDDNVPITGWVIQAANIQAKRGAIEAFTRAISQAHRDIAGDQAAARGLLPSYTSMTAEDASAIPLPTFATDNPPQQLSALIGRVQQAGWIASATDVNDYIART